MMAQTRPLSSNLTFFTMSSKLIFHLSWATKKGRNFLAEMPTRIPMNRVMNLPRISQIINGGALQAYGAAHQLG